MTGHEIGNTVTLKNTFRNMSNKSCFILSSGSHEDQNKKKKANRR